jgi:hypothetical protein
MELSPETATLGGMSLLAVHQVIMSQIRKFSNNNHLIEKFLDLFNYPVAFLLVLLISPPRPIYSFDAWVAYTSLGIATAALASIVAGKVIAQEKKQIVQLEQDVHELDTLVGTLEEQTK